MSNDGGDVPGWYSSDRPVARRVGRHHLVDHEDLVVELDRTRTSCRRGSRPGSRRGARRAAYNRSETSLHRLVHVGADQRDASSAVSGMSWPVSAFVVGVNSGSGSRSAWRSPPAPRTRRPCPSPSYSLPPAAEHVAAHDALEPNRACRPHERARARRPSPAVSGKSVGIARDHVVGDDVARSLEPEVRERGEHAALVGDLVGQDHVEHRDAIGGNHQQLVVPDLVQLADLARVDVRQRGPFVTGCLVERVERPRPCWRARASGRNTPSAAPRRASLVTSGSARSSSTERAFLLPRLHRVALHDAVGVVARVPASTSASNTGWLNTRPNDASRLRSMRSGYTRRPSTICVNCTIM